MFTRSCFLTLAFALAGCEFGTPSTLVEACQGSRGWADAAPPTGIHGNTYYVGTCAITVLLITSAEGHVLIDSGTEEAAPLILDSIRALGFDPRDVKIILGSHEHFDHMGGFAALKAATGARIFVREPARVALETGQTDSEDPQAGSIKDMAPAEVDWIVADGEIVQFGNIELTTVATPGHTSGGTSWSWNSCEAAECVDIAYVDSLTAVSAEGYRFTDHPERVEPYLTTFDRIAAMDCDLLITGHPGFSRLFERLSGLQDLINPLACSRLAESSRQRLQARLTQELQ